MIDPGRMGDLGGQVFRKSFGCHRSSGGGGGGFAGVSKGGTATAVITAIGRDKGEGRGGTSGC